MANTTFHTPSHDRRPASRQGSLIGAFAAQVLLMLRDALGASRTTHDEALRDASAVRLMAHRYRQLDRGFAADLDAAADRHEESLARVDAHH